MKNILIVDDHPMIRLAIESNLLRMINQCRIYPVGTFKEAKEMLRSHWMDLVILDLSIPEGEGIEMISILRTLQNEARILIYSGRDEMSNAPVYMAGGANGYLHKDASISEFETAVDLVLNNKKYIKKEVQQKIVDNFVNNTAVINNPIELLTSREKQILSQLMLGKWTKQIAHDLDLKISTVSTHKARILEKVQVKNVIELIKKIEPFQIEI
ncbi:two component transcriptional regulator, LuxR family [Dyadobacter koreensis]|uniref:Two component transcriptional regulator, LuxR family n=1 Tax=Dyadobacter koreensis TaxID=408657 RepID=A0A1H7ATP5_9BACT|nr:response regulator transcription factor [Dyadobacter koreensis]SEJ68973.1 two component transcriptional regulator, LuxR family [Dyadobacter koreensis]